MKVLFIAAALASAETVQAVVRASGAEQAASQTASLAEEHVRTDQAQQQGARVGFACHTKDCCEAIQGVTAVKFGQRLACGIVTNCAYKSKEERETASKSWPSRATSTFTAGCKWAGPTDQLKETCVVSDKGVPVGPATDACCRTLESDWNADASCKAVDGCEWKQKDKACRARGMSLNALPQEMRDAPEVGPAPTRKSGSGVDVPVPTRTSGSHADAVPTRTSGSHADAGQTKPDVQPDGGKKPPVESAETLPPAHESDSSGASQEAAPLPDPYDLLRKLQQQKRSEDPSELLRTQAGDGWQRKMLAEQLQRAAQAEHGDKYKEVLEEVRARDLDADPLTPVKREAHSDAVSEPHPQQCRRDAAHLRAGQSGVCVAATPELFAKLTALGWSSTAPSDVKADLVNTAVTDPALGLDAMLAPDVCCPVAKCAELPGPFTVDKDGRCRMDVNGNGVGDRFADAECCECSADTVYTWDGERCKTDINMNGTPDRFADDVCCAPAELPGGSAECTHTAHAFQGTETSSGVCVASEACTALSADLPQIPEACAGDLVCCVQQKQHNKDPLRTMVFTNSGGGLYKGKPVI